MNYDYPEVFTERSVVLMVRYFSSLVLGLSFNALSRPHLLPFSCFQGRGESCPTALLPPQRAFVHLALPGSAGPFLSGISRAGARTGWAMGPQLSPSQGKDNPWDPTLPNSCPQYKPYLQGQSSPALSAEVSMDYRP